MVFTREFDAVGPALVLLLPGMVAYGVWQLLAGHLLRIGRRGFLAATAWLFGLTSIVLQALLAQAFGLAGAAAGLSIAYVLATIVVLIAFVRLSGRPARPGARSRRPGVLRRPDTTCAGAPLSTVRSLLLAASFPPAVGGVETLLYQTNRLLTDPPLVLAPAPSGRADVTVRSVRLDLAARAAYRPSGRCTRRCTTCRPSPGLQRAAAGWRPQVIQAGHIYLAPLAWLLARRLGLPFVVYAYGQEVWRAGRAMGVRSLDALLRGKALRAASTVLVPGGFTAGLLADWRVPNARRIVAVPYGAEPRPASAAPSGKTLLTVARLIPRKGIDTVIRAMPGLPRTSSIESSAAGLTRPAYARCQDGRRRGARPFWAGWMNARSPTNIVAAPCSSCRRAARSTAISRATVWCTSKPPPGVVPSSPVAPAARSTRSSTARRASWSDGSIKQLVETIRALLADPARPALGAAEPARRDHPNLRRRRRRQRWRASDEHVRSWSTRAAASAGRPCRSSNCSRPSTVRSSSRRPSSPSLATSSATRATSACRPRSCPPAGAFFYSAHARLGPRSVARFLLERFHRRPERRVPRSDTNAPTCCTSIPACCWPGRRRRAASGSPWSGWCARCSAPTRGCAAGTPDFILRHARRVVAISDAVRDCFPNPDDSRLRRVYNTVDLAEFSLDLRLDSAPAVRAELGIASDQLIVMALGSVQRAKGHWLLLDAMLRLENPNAHLVLVTGGVGPAYAGSLRGRVKRSLGLPMDNLDALLRDAHQLGLTERLHVTGFRRDVARVLSIADVLVFQASNPRALAALSSRPWLWRARSWLPISDRVASCSERTEMPGDWCPQTPAAWPRRSATCCAPPSSAYAWVWPAENGSRRTSRSIARWPRCPPSTARRA